MGSVPTFGKARCYQTRLVGSTGRYVLINVRLGTSLIFPSLVTTIVHVYGFNSRMGFASLGAFFMWRYLVTSFLYVRKRTL